ncbi:MAG: asparagine synthetase B family protein [Thermoanaerobaculia bacterium]
MALFDPATGEGVAARDGLGGRYLAWRNDPEGPTFSRLDAELVPGGLDPDGLDTVRLAEFFAYRELSGGSTFFRGVRSLLPGELVVFRNGELRRKSISSPRLELRIRHHRWEEYVERFAELLQQAVWRCTMDIDRPRETAIWLSGGLDSTSLAALTAAALGRRGLPEPLAAISWRFRDPGGDESAFVTEVAAKIGATTHWIEAAEAVPYSNLAEWPVHPSTPEQTPYRWLHERSYARAAALGAKVVLNGFNGDVLYGHGRRWFWTLLAAGQVGRAIDGLRSVAREIGGWAAVRSQLIGPALPKRRSLRRTLPDYLTEGARSTLDALPRYPANAIEARRPRQAERLLSLLDSHGDDLERWFAARFGVEARSPFRDPDLVRWMLAVPDHLLQQGTTSRPILRAATRGLIPENVRKRRSKGRFQVLLERGFSTQNLAWATQVLFDEGALWRPYVREESVRRWLEGRFANQIDMVGFVQVLNAELWRLKRRGVDLGSLQADQKTFPFELGDQSDEVGS